MMRWIETYGNDSTGIEVTIYQNMENGRYHAIRRDNTDADMIVINKIYYSHFSARMWAESCIDN